MTANNTNKNTPSAKRKLIPAAAMLLASSMALASSTYAWFTMSKEVSVTGIQMTASVPEGLEISLGDGQKAGNLVAETGTQSNATNIAVPGDDDWSNSVRVSDYYRFGYLVPASSDTGEKIFYTGDAIDAGVAVTQNATFTRADSSLAAGMTSFTIDTSKFTGTGAWDIEENTKGYYIDIPVWFRTSVTSADVNLKVVANIIDGPAGAAKEAVTPGSGGTLYNAARVSILGSGSAANSGTQAVLVDDDYVVSTAGKYYDRYTITGKKNLAVKENGSLNGTLAAGNTAATAPTNFADIFGETTFVTQASRNTANNGYDGDTVVTVTKATSGWSSGVQYTIRVWLEGEDKNCWDSTAGQDFTVDLKFYRADDPKAATAANKTS